jgi:type VI secretion system secreted protein VgrG
VAQQISVEITINGKKITPFSHLSLKQSFNEHHSFELRFNHDVLETSGTMTIEKSKDYLGKPITIALNDLKKSKADNVFKGIVTDVRFSNNINSAGDIVFSGYSPTILLDSGETNSSHLARTLTQVVKEVTGEVAANDLTVKVNPVKKNAIPFIVQYRESNFCFVRRLAAEYGEHFFYDGGALNFGKPAQADNVSLQYPNDISDLSLRARIAPLSGEQHNYLSKEDKKLLQNSKSAEVAGLDTMGKHALSVSDKLFGNKSTTLTRRKFLEAKELEEAVKISKSTAAGDLVVLHANSDSPFIKLGATVHVTADKTDYGKFTVTSVNHKTDGLGNYQNEFESVPSTIAVMPSTYDKKPIAEPQIGIVKEIKDPDKMGKVKVQMLWQKDTNTTPYIRVLTPHGGTYGDNKKTRGHFFTPEVNDHVIVGFTQNDPDRPFVMGSFPHGKAIDSAPSSDKNNIKSISTRSGNIVSFIDKEDAKEREIRIQTDDTNYISINLKNSDGTIKIYSSKAIEVNSKETIVVKSGKSIDVSSDKTINVKSEKITIEASDSITMKANKKIEIKAMEVAIEGSKSFEAKGGATAKVSGAQTEIDGSATTKVNGGAKLDLSGGAMATLKGGIVQIN